MFFSRIKVFVVRFFANLNFKVTKDSFSRKIDGLRGTGPIFVVGNGPSLNIADLDHIHRLGIPSIASNKVFLGFETCEWRPTIYTIADKLVWQEIRQKIPEGIKTVFAPSSFFGSCSVQKISWKALSNTFEITENNFSKDLLEGIYGGETVTYENIQIAVNLGYDPIYLIGCDHYYPGESETGNNVVVHSGEKTHFIDGYRTKGQISNKADIGKMNTAYTIARHVAMSKSVSIYNLTRGGYLEVFDRVNLDEVFFNLRSK